MIPASPLADRPAELLLLLGALSLAPFALVTLTSFLKMVVVLSAVRSALGAPQIPPSSAITGLALLLTLVAMAPVGEAAWVGLRAPPERGEPPWAAAGRAVEPLRGFLAHHARPDDQRAFLELARRARPEGSPPGERDLSVLAPAFVVSELRRAFTMGFLVFLPFLAVDLVVANVLLALGLTQLSPNSVSLPFKLLLFATVDGWALLSRGLVLGYLQ